MGILAGMAFSAVVSVEQELRSMHRWFLSYVTRLSPA